MMMRDEGAIIIMQSQEYTIYSTIHCRLIISINNNRRIHTKIQFSIISRMSCDNIENIDT